LLAIAVKNLENGALYQEGGDISSGKRSVPKKEAKEHKQQLERLKETVRTSLSILWLLTIYLVCLRVFHFIGLQFLLLRRFYHFMIVTDIGYLQQPEFYKYLEEVDKELLDFHDEGIEVS